MGSLSKSALEEFDPNQKLTAVVELGSRFFQVKKHDYIIVNRVKVPVGNHIFLSRIRAIGNDSVSLVGRPLVNPSLAFVKAQVMEHMRSAKMEIVRFRPRKHHHRVKGHRQNLSVLRISDVNVRSQDDSMKISSSS